MAVSRPRRVIVLLALLVAGLAGVAFHRPILSAAGRLLVDGDKLEKADAAVVLSGEQSNGLRVTAAVRLYKEGWVRRIVLSGAPMGYGRHESDFSLARAVALGVPREDLLALPLNTRSTQEEAEYMLPRMESAGIRSFYVVSSNYHTVRARRIFQRVAGKRMRVLAFPAHDDGFQPDSWWQSELGIRVFLLESLKQVTSMANL